MGAPIGERVEAAPDAIQADAASAQVDDRPRALGRSIRERDTCLAPAHDVAVGTESRKSSCALRQLTPSRHSTGS